MSLIESADSSKPRSVRYESLDLWRGAACLMVVMDHAALNLQALGGPLFSKATSLEEVLRWLVAGLTSLAWGPPMFFVMSGYCACSSLESTSRKGLPPWAFLARRVWRIFPPYWISLFALIAVLTICNAGELRWLYQDGPALGLGDPSRMTTGNWIGNLTLTETWRPAEFPKNSQMLVNTAAWTLCIQEQFYLICFLALSFFPRRLHLSLAAASAMFTAYVLLRWDSGGLHQLNGLFLQYWHEFFCGMVVYWAIHLKPEHRSRFEAGLAALLVIFALAGLHGGMIAAGFAIVMIRAYRWDQSLAKAPSLKLMRTLGRGSYGIYLGHLPFCIMVSNALWLCGITSFWASALVIVPAALTAGLIGGWVFHRAAERRFSGMPQWLDRLAKRRPAAAPLPGPTFSPDLALALLRESSSSLSRSGSSRDGLGLSGSSLALLKG